MTRNVVLRGEAKYHKHTIIVHATSTISLPRKSTPLRGCPRQTRRLTEYKCRDVQREQEKESYICRKSSRRDKITVRIHREKTDMNSTPSWSSLQRDTMFTCTPSFPVHQRYYQPSALHALRDRES